MEYVHCTFYILHFILGSKYLKQGFVDIEIENNYNCSTTCDIYYLHCTSTIIAASRKPLLWSVTARGSAGLLIETKTLLQIFLQKQLSSANTKLQWFLKYQMLNDLLLTSNTTLTARQVWLTVFFIPTEVY